MRKNGEPRRPKVRRLGVAVGLMLLAAAGQAQDWKPIAESDGTKFYIDLTSVREIGSIRRAWTVTDLKVAEAGKVKSRRMLVELNCAEGRSRLLSVATYSGSMLSGERLFKADITGEWAYIAPGTTGDMLQKVVCP